MTSPKLLEINDAVLGASVHSQRNAKHYLYGEDVTSHYVAFDDSVKI